MPRTRAPRADERVIIAVGVKIIMLMILLPPFKDDRPAASYHYAAADECCRHTLMLREIYAITMVA